jgi:microcystin-dependent protein
MLTRGVNPIWWIPNLVGQPMDDTYYLFTLSNTIPYLPIVVYHDAGGTIPWTDPIQMLANGTVPIDVYWDDNTVYRLEWRAGPTQNDTLIYLVENYMPGEGGGSGPVTNGTNDTTNQITNPQFAVVNFTGTLTSTASSLLNVAPGWDIVTTGSGPGSISVTQLQVEGVSGDSTNPSFALQIMSSGWDTVGIQQTFAENGALWASGINDISGVALEISAYNSSGTAPPLSGIISYTGTDAPGPTTIFTAASINAAPNSYGGAAALPISTNTSLPADAATAVSFVWTSNNTVVVTSAQLIGQQGEDIAEVAYQQESIERQIDHFYHLAYPITPVGTIIDFGGFGTPAHYLFCDGTAYSRTTYSQLFSALTTTMTVSLTNTMNTFTVSSAINLYIGMAIEGNGIAAATTISNISGTTITMSAAATATVTSVVTFFAWGDGDGSTTFNVPDLRGYVTGGSQGSLFTSNGAGNKGGSSTQTLITANVPAHTHNISLSIVNGGSGFGFASGTARVPGTFTTDNGSGSGTAFSIVQQTALVNKFIRFE